MAVTDIQTTVSNLTGVSPSANTVEDAQKFVVASIPKELLQFAQKASSSSTDGSALSFSMNDSIIDVQRNGYSCREVPLSQSQWASDSTSLRYATSKHPVFYHKQGAVHFLPITDGSNAGYVFYVDFSLIDDDSDLRNAVIFHASSSEFSKLSSAELPSVSIGATAPTAPTLASVVFSSIDADIDAASPSFTTATISAAGVYGTDNGFNDYYPISDFPDTDPGVLTISVSAPVTPPDPSISSSGVGTISQASMSTNLPSYSKPVLATQVAFASYWTLADFGDSDPTALSVAAVPPDIPSIASVSYSVATEVDIAAVSDASVTAIAFPTSDIPTYSKPSITARVSFNDFFESGSLNPLDDSDPGVLTVSVSAPTTPSDPSISSDSISPVTVESLPTAPSYVPPTVGGVVESLTNTMDADSAGYGTENDFLNFSKWFSVAGEFIEDEEDNEMAAIQLQKINTYVTTYQSALQDSLNTFNEANVVYQAGLQRNLEQSRINAQEAHKEADMTLQAAIQDYTLEIQLFQGEISKYQAQVNDEVQEYGQKLSRYQLELNTVFQAWSKTESDSLSQFQVDVQNELNEFNMENADFQLKFQESTQEAQNTNAAALQNMQKELQRASTDAQSDSTRRLQDAIQATQATISNNGNLIQKFQAELQQYQSEVNAEVQEHSANVSRYQLELNTVYTAWAKTETDNLQAYQLDIQNELNEFNKENVRYQANIQAEIAKHQTDAAEAQKEGDMTLQAAIQDYAQELTLFSGEINKYQAQVSDEVQEYSQRLARYQLELNTTFQAWTKELDVAIQESIQELQVANQVNISSAQAALQVAIRNEDKSQERVLQNSINDMQAIVQNNQSLLTKYQAQLQQYGAEVQAELGEYQNKLQKQQSYSNESKKYYEWAKMEVKSYIENNSKMIRATLAARASQGARA